MTGKQIAENLRQNRNRWASKYQHQLRQIRRRDLHRQILEDREGK